ncbi:MAG: hypothetical protein M1546_14070 [Chloroflexi bacterium]|nr:hypothetical protein [Chloroflexota bacterium]
MHRLNSSPWQLQCGFPEYLQLSGIIAQQEGFRLDGGAPPVSPAEAEWRAWWESLLIPQPENVATTSEWGNPWLRVNYDPPTFTRLARWPAVQALCQRHFPTFHQHWGTVGGDKLPMANQLGEQLRRVRIDKIVKICAATAGKRESAPFKLTVDFVVWPPDYRRIISDTYVVLGKRYLDPAQATTLRGLLQELVARLV